MKKNVLLLACSVLLIVTAFAWIPTASGKDAKDLDGMKIASLVNEMNKVTPGQLQEMAAIPPKPYTLPDPGVDVMRARLTENYTIAGIGEDSVELNGWIAVAHGKPSTSEWNTAVTETRFVALDLHGESKIFGPVHVTFDPDHLAVGQVGRSVELPENARIVLAKANAEGKKQSKPRQQATPSTKQPADSKVTTAPSSPTAAPSSDPCSDGASCFICRAPVSVAVAMPNLGLTMKTKVPATWFSIVNTIPPVGHTASVTIEPVSLVANDGREVGTLNSGRVLFRETVRHVGLSHDVDVTTRVAEKPAAAVRPAASLKK